jgi:phosphoribosylanthranilate isomerase
MLDTAAKVNRFLPRHDGDKLRMIIQIYEIQTPHEAEAVIELGVDHVGSVILDAGDWQQPLVRETVDCVKRLGAASSLIPLFRKPDNVLRTLDYYRPNIVHFCDMLPPGEAGLRLTASLADLQSRVRRDFPDIKIMRSVPIRREAPSGETGGLIERMVRELSPLSDFFLIDTLLAIGPQAASDDQPVNGFIGITGLTCDWTAAGRLVDASPVPVILAGGLSPENVYDGIMHVRPAGVDSCTGTNAVDAAGAPVRFRKDPARVRRFVEAARRTQRDVEKGRGRKSAWPLAAERPG